MEVEQSVPEVEPNEPSDPVEPNEAVVIKKRGRPPGSLNRKTIEKMRQDVLPEDAPEDPGISPMILDVEFTSDEILGEKPRATPKRKPKKAPPKRDPPTEPPSEDESPPPPPPPPPKKKKRQSRVNTHLEKRPVTEHASMALNPPTYLEVLTRGLKEQRAKQHAEKIAQYDIFSSGK